ncbi:MAG: hypothetical protein WC967_04825 [Balneolaceae bacterium]
MSNQPNAHLFQLIKSLTKAEKRGFKIYATRTNSHDAKFIQLFDAIDKSSDYDEEAIIKRVRGIQKRQLSNLKAHLYKQILISLRLININHNVDIQLREQIDYARILYNKGLYRQSLRILERAKEIAAHNHRTTLSYEILVFEKIIESQFITRSLRNRADELIQETEDTLDSLDRYNTLSNLSLRLYSIYIKAGHVRNEKDFKNTEKFFRSALESVDLTKLGFFEEHYLYVSYAWYSLIVQDFLLQYRYSQKWVELFRKNPDMLALEPIWYIKGMHVLLEALFMLGHYDKHEQELKHLEEFVKNPPSRTNENLETIGFMYSYTSKINSHFIAGTFSEGIKLVPELNQELDRFSTRVDPHRILIFYYKIACLYFGAGENLQAIHYLNKIINYPDQRLREDIHCFARILSLIAHFELGNETLVDYQIRSTYRFLRKMNDLNMVQEEILKFLRNLGGVKQSEVRNEFIKLRSRLLEINEMPFQKRHFLYLDIISWLEAKIANKPVQDIIKGKFKPRHSSQNKVEHPN